MHNLFFSNVVLLYTLTHVYDLRIVCLNVQKPRVSVRLGGQAEIQMAGFCQSSRSMEAAWTHDVLQRSLGTARHRLILIVVRFYIHTFTAVRWIQMDSSPIP